MFFLCTFVCIALSVFVNCEQGCVNFQSCDACISYGDDFCIWCYEENHEGPRCQSENWYNKNLDWCNASTYSPEKLTNERIVQEPLSDGANGSKIIELTPQTINFTARPGSMFIFNMSYMPARDYPLDVYFLMDYSETMKKYKSILEKQALKTYETLSKLTNNVRLGLGSFVEKVGFPFTDIQISYSFKHHLTLTENTTMFIESIREPSQSNDTVKVGNYDDPEATLDALMQAMVCEEIGWRADARRIIVVSTDASYHSVGDGRTVGAIKPNDMKCHLKDNYASSNLDYPSVGQINKVATEGNIRIIFATEEKVKDHYLNLVRNIHHSKYTPLTINSNIADLIKLEYVELTRYLNLEYDVPAHLQLILNPACNDNERCELKYKTAVNVTGTVKVKNCPKDKSNIIKMGPVGLNNKMVIEVDVDCECDCKKQGVIEEKSPKCNSSGTFQCGICNCDLGRYGDVCQCNGTSSDTVDEYKCKANETICSGRGICRCGNCECLTGYSGDFCQYNDQSCKRLRGELCAGHGKCQFGSCSCNEGYTGDDCRCNTKYCFAPQSAEICSGNGECDCDQCRCKNSDYTGAYCDECVECTSKRCKELENYAYCNYLSNKLSCDEQYGQTSDTEVTLLNKTEMESSNSILSVQCKKVFENGTTLHFKYFYRKPENILVLLIQKDLEPPLKLNIWVPVGSAIGAVLLIGIITVIVWKILIDIHDAREYKKFEQLSAQQGYDVSKNPLYEPPEVNFMNPTFRNSN